MKRFLIKFSILFAVIWGLIGYYVYCVYPNLSGDMGHIGQIPFGTSYNERIEAPYKDMPMRVHTIRAGENIEDSVITIGDSFSQHGRLGYSNFLANRWSCRITNIAMEDVCLPEQTFVRLVKAGKIQPGSVVIVESVERSVIRRLSSLDCDEEWSGWILDEGMNDEGVNGKRKVDYLDGLMVWLRTSLGMKQTIHRYHTDRDLFSHDTRHDVLYIYDSRWDEEGDLRFVKNLSKQNVVAAYNNLLRLHVFAEEHGVQLVYLVAADKYDVYEPFITEKHERNATLESLPDAVWIVNSKALLQEAVYAGVKDVYYINDTHWSPIGAKMVAEEIIHRINASNSCENCVFP